MGVPKIKVTEDQDTILCGIRDFVEKENMSKEFFVANILCSDMFTLIFGRKFYYSTSQVQLLKYLYDDKQVFKVVDYE